MVVGDGDASANESDVAVEDISGVSAIDSRLAVGDDFDSIVVGDVGAVLLGAGIPEKSDVVVEDDKVVSPPLEVGDAFDCMVVVDVGA